MNKFFKIISPVSFLSFFSAILFTACLMEENQVPTLEEENAVKDSAQHFLALGDSYTIGESVSLNENWPSQLSNKLNELEVIDLGTPDVIARTGWRTDELINAAKSNSRRDYKLVSLLIGVNNQYQGKSIDLYEREFEQLIKMSISFANDDTSNVIIISIPDYGYTPFGLSKQATISMELDNYNLINKKYALKYGIKYFDITPISRSKNSKLVASDKLHPSAFQYSLWVEKIISDNEFLESLSVK